MAQEKFVNVALAQSKLGEIDEQIGSAWFALRPLFFSDTYRPAWDSLRKSPTVRIKDADYSRNTVKHVLKEIAFAAEQLARDARKLEEDIEPDNIYDKDELKLHYKYFDEVRQDNKLLVSFDHDHTLSGAIWVLAVCAPHVKILNIKTKPGSYVARLQYLYQQGCGDVSQRPIISDAKGYNASMTIAKQVQAIYDQQVKDAKRVSPGGAAAAANKKKGGKK